MTSALIGKLGYLGIALLLVLGGLGLPVPEEAPIILAAVLSKNETLWWPLALAACFIGVLLGDFVVYFLGYYYGERVLSLKLTRKFLTQAREAQIKGYFHRHGFKILILGRFAVGFRTAAYLTAGILKLPALKLLLTDICAATLSTGLMFGLGYVFAHQIERSFDKVKHWLTASIALALIGWLGHRYYKARQQAGRPVGPPVLVSDDAPLPPDDLHPPPPASRHTPTTAEPVAVEVAIPIEPPVLPPAAPEPRWERVEESVTPAPAAAVPHPTLPPQEGRA